MKEGDKDVVEEYRLKIKKLKLKIEQAEDAHKQLEALRNRSRLFEQSRAGGHVKPLQSALGRVSFSAGQRGLTLQDLFRAVDASTLGSIDTEEYILLLRRLGVNLERQEEEGLREAMGRECDWDEYKTLIEGYRR